jgi:hypothetical protein
MADVNIAPIRIYFIGVVAKGPAAGLFFPLSQPPATLLLIIEKA